MRKGVSLIELMVVLAILMVLMAIMLPVYVRALGHVTGGVCMSNMHQIHTALTIYSSDYEGARVGQAGAVYPPDMPNLRLPLPVTSCRDRTPYVALWFTLQERPDPVLVVDANRLGHQERVIGLFASGSVQRRGGEGDPLDPRFWR